MDECPFCESSSPPLENDHAYVRPDKYPVSKGHLLICPRRRFSDFFDATPEERSAMLSLPDEAKAMSMESLAPAGFNVGINCGRAAGQTVMHVHIHLIPRYTDDMSDPSGGVRGVIEDRDFNGAF